ncbi:MAG: succinate--CoA ligase subunit alpha [Desulfurococcaceae archaeon]|nr:succinate--CoA ligase subunit alpha [Desulfurococcaceae archaeon]
MGILVNHSTRAIVQGITGREGSFHTKLMLDYGTKIVAGTSPGKGGSYVHGVPVYNTIYEAVREQGPIDASIIFVPARFASDAVYEAIDHGIRVVVVITEGIPLHEEVKFVNYAKIRGVDVVGPNTPGVMTVNECKLGIMPAHVFKRGYVGLVSRSGTLTYEIARELSKRGYGVSTVIGLGGDPVTGLDFIDVYERFLRDNETKAVVLIGEIGGDAEERFATYYTKLTYKKPVVAYIAGRTAPPGKRMGHAGAIISMGMGDYKSKRSSLENADIPVAETPSQVPILLESVLGK